MVQQIHQIMRAPQQPTIQQIITSMPSQTQPTTATVITTQLVSQAHPTQTFTKMAVNPASLTTSSATHTVRTSIGGVSAVVSNAPTTLVGAQLLGHIATTQAVGGIAPTVTLSGTPTPPSTLVKHVQEVMVSPQKTIPIQGSLAQVKTVQQQVVATHRQQTQLAAVVGTAHVHSPAQQQQTITATQPQAVTVQQQLQQTVKQQQQPSPKVQAVVQQVVQHAQAQAQQRPTTQVVSGASAVIATSTPPVAASQTISQVVQQPSTTLVQGSVPVVQTTTSQHVVVQQQIQQQLVGVTDQSGQQQARASPYGMRLRNTRTSQSQ